MNQGNGLPNCRNYILLSALIVALTCAVNVPAFAASSPLLERLLLNLSTPSFHEKSKAERMRAVEKARTTFEQVPALGKKAAPYEYYLAQGYLRLATKELSEGDRTGVVEFAAESERYSRVAAKKAEGYQRLATRADIIAILKPEGQRRKLDSIVEGEEDAAGEAGALCSRGPMLFLSGCAAGQPAENFTDRYFEIAAKLNTAEQQGAGECFPRELAHARVELEDAFHEAKEPHYPRSWVLAAFDKVETAANIVLCSPSWRR